MAAAHHALLANDVDFKAALKEFSDYAADLKPLVPAKKTPPNKTPPKKTPPKKTVAAK